MRLPDRVGGGLWYELRATCSRVGLRNRSDRDGSTGVKRQPEGLPGYQAVPLAEIKVDGRCEGRNEC